MADRPADEDFWRGDWLIAEAPDGRRFKVSARVWGIGSGPVDPDLIDGKFEVRVEKFPRVLSRARRWRRLSSAAARTLYERTVQEIEAGTWAHLGNR